MNAKLIRQSMKYYHDIKCVNWKDETHLFPVKCPVTVDPQGHFFSQTLNDILRQQRDPFFNGLGTS